MASNYQKDMYRQLAELMLKHDTLTKDVKNIKTEHKQDIQELKTEYKKEKEILNTKIDTLENELSIVKVENVLLKNDNERLKRIINNDSSNSSKPPSSDIKGNKPNHYSSRTKSGKKAGGQKGRKGVALTKEMVEEKIRCGELECEVIPIGIPTGEYKSRYVIDLKIITQAKEYRFYKNAKGKIIIPTEFHTPVTYGPTLKTIIVDLYGEGAMSIARIQDFINSISSRTSISEGSIYNALKQFDKKIQPLLESIKKNLLNELVLYTDATNVRVAGGTGYVRNQSSLMHVLYMALAKKNLEYLHLCYVLENFTGILMHDHEIALYHFGTGHAECNVHIERYLQKNTEEARNEWSQQLKKILQEMHLMKKEKTSRGDVFSCDEIQKYEYQYDQILKLGRLENRETKGTYAKNNELTLLNRLKKYKDNHLLFLRIPEVAYENNLSERDLRKCKVKQKVSGCFRKQSGCEMYCNIISVIETCKRQKLGIMDSIENIFLDKPVSLA